MDPIFLLKSAHILGACVLIGTGAGIAFFMLMAHRTRDTHLIAQTAEIVVLADWLFTASAVVLQPITGVALAHINGWSLWEPWIVASIAIYLAIGAFWLPVEGMQKQMRDLARAAAESPELPERYHILFRRWFLCGIPAFGLILILLYLMVAKPSL